MDYILTFPAFVALVAFGAWWYIQRHINRQDKVEIEVKKRADEVLEQRLTAHGMRIGAVEDRAHKLELELSTKVGREELDKLYARLDEVRREFKEDLKELKADLIAVIREK